MTQAALAHGLVELCKLRDASSVHVTFMTEAELHALGARGFLMRTDQQFHWDNAGLCDLRRFSCGALLAQAQGDQARAARRGLPTASRSCGSPGRDLTEAAWDAFFAFYMETGSRKWGRPYLTRRFFSLIGETMADRDRADHGEAQRPLHRRRDQFHRRRHAVRPSLGREANTTRSCISRSAITRRSTSPSPAGFSASRPAPRASTSSPAAICPARPIRRITSPTLRLRRAIDDYLKRERAYVEAAGCELSEASPFRKIDADEESAREDAGF